MNFLLNILKPSKTLHVFYRHVHLNNNFNKNRPNWFTYETCFKNFINSIFNNLDVDINIKLNIMFDGDEKSYQENFLKNYTDFLIKKSKENKIDYKEIIFTGGSSAQSWYYCIDYILKENYPPSDYIYMLENDYLHNDRWIFYLNELINSKIPFDYISLYDHKDKYPFHKGFHLMHKNLTAELFITESRHWRKSPSTCGSFITSVKIFREDIHLIRSNLMDHEIFAELGKLNRVLLTPIPGLSTHCMNNLLSPCVDWRNCIV